MLNLLFISDSPKAEYVKGMLQPLLKVIIDVVTDFDHGLKDVFEKRPATVCIQDQIGGVTGESVARHIQMLLGNSAPTFILLHTGNDKARVITGLYEHIVDLSQPNEALAENVINILKTLLGDQWEKIYILPKQSPASVRPSVALPEESREDADRLVDDFLSDLKMSAISAIEDKFPVTPPQDKVSAELTGVASSDITHKPEAVSGTDNYDRAGTISDDLAEVKKNGQDKSGPKTASVVAAGPGVDSLASPESATGFAKQPSGTVSMSPGLSESTPTGTQSARTAPSDPEKKVIKTSSVPVTAVFTPPAAEFRINQNQFPTEDALSEDLLQAFEKNYRSDSNLFRRIAVTVLVFAICATGGWYLFKRKLPLAGAFKKHFFSSSVSTQAPSAPPVASPAKMPASVPVPQSAVTPPLPAFIPADGHDSSYSVKNPGWERYVAKRNEFRVFISSGRIQAVQVLAKGAPLSGQLIKAVLQELAGNSQYQITSRSVKAGVNVETGTIQNKGEIVLYKKNGSVQAFVVSVN